MPPIRCVIIDDEPLAIELLQGYIAELENLELLASFKKATDAYPFLRTNEIDLLFLDIEIPGISGLDFLKSLEKAPQVIITTAYREFALEGYELNVVDYLLKPIPFPRFIKAIDKVYEPDSKPNRNQEFPDHLFVKSERKNQKVNFSEILYVESKKDYLKIVMLDKSLITKDKISDFIENLPASIFLRVHRSYVVNLDQISSFTNKDIEIGEIEIPIGGKYKENVLDLLNSKNKRM